MTPESQVKYLICSYLSRLGVYFWNNDSMGVFDPVRKCFRSNKNPYRIKGVSDLVGVLPGGRFLAIEVKIPEVRSPSTGKRMRAPGRLSPEQVVFIDRVNAEGGLAFVARSIEDVKAKVLPVLQAKVEVGK